MKTTKEYIDRILIHKGNLEHIASTGKINGGLAYEIANLIRDVRREAITIAMKEGSKYAILSDHVINDFIKNNNP